jgi:hypothetical protein
LCDTNISAAKSKVVASARHVSTSLAEAAKIALASPQSKVSTVNSSHQECCADSGATEHMLNDYDAFVSYHPCKNEFVTLGDDTRLKIYGRGSDRFLLNGRVIQVRNALHVPDLRAPLYFLRRHRHMDGCGYYSQYGVGSFILFPSFTIEVDDTTDNLVSYKSLGHSHTKALDYKEPRVPTARPAHIIPPDDDWTQIKINIPDPKARSPPAPSPSPTPPPSPPPQATPSTPDDSIVISDSDLVDSAKKTLTKRMIAQIHDDLSSLPEVPPEYTPGPSEHTTTFDSLRLHCIFRCRRFKNQNHITAASKNAELLKCGEMPSTIGDFVTINNPNKG